MMTSRGTLTPTPILTAPGIPPAAGVGVEGELLERTVDDAREAEADELVAVGRELDVETEVGVDVIEEEVPEAWMLDAESASCASPPISF